MCINPITSIWNTLQTMHQPHYNTIIFSPKQTKPRIWNTLCSRLTSSANQSSKGDKALWDLCACQTLAQLSTALCGPCLKKSHPSFSAASAAGQILTRPPYRWVSVGNSEEHDWQTTDERWLEHLSQSLKQPARVTTAPPLSQCQLSGSTNHCESSKAV